MESVNKEGNGFGVRKRLPIYPCAPPPLSADEEGGGHEVCVCEQKSCI